MAIAAIFAGVLPLLVGAVVAGIGDRYMHPGLWIAGLSPVSLPLSAPLALLSITEVDQLPVRAIQAIAKFGWIAWTPVCLGLLQRQQAHRSALRRRILGGDGDERGSG